jgi:hypothetical protein
VPPPPRALPLRHRSYGLMCHSRWALFCFGIQPRLKSLGRLYAVPAAHGSFPTLSLKVFPWMLDPIPRRYIVCSHLFLPRCHRPSPNRDGSASRVCPTNYDFSRGESRGCRYSLMFRPPSLLTPQIVPTAAILPQGSRGFYIRAYRALLPSHAPDMLTVRTQVIDGTGTCTLPDSQPCRLLTLLSRSFVCECHTISTVPRFQPPPRRTQHVVFPHCALLFASPQGLWDLSCWRDFRHQPPNLVAVIQPQRFV